MPPFMAYLYQSIPCFIRHSFHVVLLPIVLRELHRVLILCFFVDSFVVAAACEDRSLHVYSSSTGRRLCPAIVLDDAASYLFCASVYVMVVTTRGAVSVW